MKLQVALHETSVSLHTFAESVNMPLQPRPEGESRLATVAMFAEVIEAECIITLHVSTEPTFWYL